MSTILYLLRPKHPVITHNVVKKPAITAAIQPHAMKILVSFSSIIFTSGLPSRAFPPPSRN